MCGQMTKDDLQIFADKVTSAHTDYKLANDAITFEHLILATQDMYMALREQKAINAEQARKLGD